MSSKQKKLWEFFCDYQKNTGTFPAFRKTAEYFGTSTAAVSHRIDVLKSKGLLARVPLVGNVLLNEDGSVYHSDKEDFYRNSHLEVCLSNPCKHLNISENTVFFTLLKDFSDRFHLRYGDFLIVNKVSSERLRSGDMVVIKNKEIYSIQIYMSVQRPKGYASRPIPEYIYDKKIPGNKIIGVVAGVYRDTSSGVF